MKKIDLNKVARATPCVSLLEAWQDETYIVQVSEVYHSEISTMRLSVRRLDGGDGIPWDDIQDIKRKIGMGDRWGVEVYPRQKDIMNNMNARHIFLLNDRPDFAWVVDNDEELKKQIGWK